MTEFSPIPAHPEALCEMALGVLDPEERTSVLAHLARCPACREDLLELSAVADQLAAHAPSVEPPAGFEDRVLARLDAAVFAEPVPFASRSDRSRGVAYGAKSRSGGAKRPFSWKHIATAAAVAAIALGAGTAIDLAGGSSTTPSPAAAGGSWYSTLLVGPSGPVGKVFVDSDGRPWMSMGISGGQLGTLRCELVSPSGKVLVLGTFEVTSQGGYWATYIPAAAKGATTVRLVDITGKMVATATIR